MFNFKNTFKNYEEQKEYQDMLCRLEEALYPEKGVIEGSRLIAYCETIIHRMQLEGKNPKEFNYYAEKLAEASDKEIEEADRWIMIRLH